MPSQPNCRFSPCSLSHLTFPHPPRHQPSREPRATSPHAPSAASRALPQPSRASNNLLSRRLELIEYREIAGCRRNTTHGALVLSSRTPSAFSLPPCFSLARPLGPVWPPSSVAIGRPLPFEPAVAHHRLSSPIIAARRARLLRTPSLSCLVALSAVVSVRPADQRADPEEPWRPSLSSVTPTLSSPSSSTLILPPSCCTTIVLALRRTPTTR
ncbi:hypothetical protein F4678DRAFT_267760 [Xylaria arbuscula]|nr:hypothetical protein F4678DRAFT_267760 [Xylaria arbuscula]